MRFTEAKKDSVERSEVFRVPAVLAADEAQVPRRYISVLAQQDRAFFAADVDRVARQRVSRPLGAVARDGDETPGRFGRGRLSGRRESGPRVDRAAETVRLNRRSRRAASVTRARGGARFA